MEKSHLIFADGSSLGNPGPSGWGAIVVVNNRIVRELGGGKKHSTNNEMELTAVLQSLMDLEHEPGDVHIYTDSAYVVNGATKWIFGWMKRGWVTTAKTPVENQLFWKKIIGHLKKREEHGKVRWHHVPGHSGVAGNERADAIATAFAAGETPELFDGVLSKYAVDVLNIDIDPNIHEARVREKKRSRMKAYSYVSKVGEEVMVHASWGECELRVRGTRGALFKKVSTPDEERKLVREWSRR
jgi:ribonuclease HI